MEDEYRVKNGDIADIKERLAGIEMFQQFIKDRLDKMPLPGEGPVCSLVKDRIDKVETEVSTLRGVAGKQNLIAGTMGAIATGLVLALRYVVGER